MPPTRLTNGLGADITVVTVNLEAITIDGTDPDITPPAPIVVNADAGGCTADVTVPALVATDNCGVIASIVNDYNGTADASDTYPSGLTTITWTVTDECGNESTETQDITVNAVNDLALDLSLSGSVVSPLTVGRSMRPRRRPSGTSSTSWPSRRSSAGWKNRCRCRKASAPR